MFERKNLYFLIEGGRALDLVKRYIAEMIRVNDENVALAKELGVERYQTNSITGLLVGVVLDEPREGFTKPDRKNGVSFPKKGTELSRRLAGRQGLELASSVIADEFSIPLNVRYEFEGGSGSTCIGNPLNECGFLYLSADGPFAMWIPDVQAIVADYEAKGRTVLDPAKSFKPAIDGARQIEKEEWEIIVAQDKLAKKRAA